MLTMLLKEIMSSSRTIKNLTCLFAQDLLQYFSSKETFKLFVVYDNKVKGPNFEEDHSREEVDTLIPHYVLASVSEDAWHQVFVWSPDTDVLVLHLHLAYSRRLDTQTRLKFLTGRGYKLRTIDVYRQFDS